MPERNPTAFAGVGSGPIRVLACVSELVEIRIVRWLAGEKKQKQWRACISSHIGFWIAGKPIVRLNRYACRDPWANFPGTSRNSSLGSKALISLGF
jgi:hypothetical protein